MAQFFERKQFRALEGENTSENLMQKGVCIPKTLRKVSLSIFLILSLIPGFGQLSIADSTIGLTLIEISYQGGQPSGTWGQSWGYTSTLGLNVGRKTAQNWYARLGAHFLFADNAAIGDALDAITTPDGLLIADNGELSLYELLGTGFYAPITFGKVIPWKGPNTNSGLYIEVGGHYLEHRVRVRALDGRVPAIRGDYLKGYDQLQGGFGLQEGIGYRFFANNGDVNFAAGLAFSQTYSQPLRSVYFPSGSQVEGQNWDLWWGFQVSWSYAIYQRAPKQTYYY